MRTSALLADPPGPGHLQQNNEDTSESVRDVEC
eukprot:COSAG02_NODE_42680_length_382_cov_0.872792_1_plen_32_part_10